MNPPSLLDPAKTSAKTSAKPWRRFVAIFVLLAAADMIWMWAAFRPAMSVWSNDSLMPGETHWIAWTAVAATAVYHWPGSVAGGLGASWIPTNLLYAFLLYQGFRDKDRRPYGIAILIATALVFVYATAYYAKRIADVSAALTSK